MAGSSTERIARVVQDHDALVTEFLGDLARGACGYEGSRTNWLEASPGQVGEAFHTWLWVVLDVAPALAEDLVPDDLSGVDWAAVGTPLKERMAQAAELCPTACR